MVPFVHLSIALWLYTIIILISIVSKVYFALLLDCIEPEFEKIP